MCQLNLEAYQQRIGQVFGESYHLPIVFFSQLVGLALGFSAEEMMLDQMVVGAEAVAARPSEARA
jgi:heterodisulfide reductase subunit B